MSSSNLTTSPTYAAAAATAVAIARRSPSPTSPKYVPVHKRGPSDPTLASARSSSPTPSEGSEGSSSSLASSQPRGVYSIASLLHLAQEPQVKVASLIQRETLKQVFPEILMSRKMRKGMEYHAIQERMRTKAQLIATPMASLPAPPLPVPTSTPSQLRQRPGQRRQGRVVGTDRRRNATKIVDEASWRTVRPIRLVVPTAPGPQHVSISAA